MPLSSKRVFKYWPHWILLTESIQSERTSNVTIFKHIFTDETPPDDVMMDPVNDDVDGSGEEPGEEFINIEQPSQPNVLSRVR